MYESFNFEFNARPGRGITLFGGLAVERQLDVTCTAPDDPNTLRFCDDTENGIPTARASSSPARCRCTGASTLSGVFQSNHGTREQPDDGRRRAAPRAIRPTCPAPCPAGEIIMPTALFGQPSLTVNLWMATRSTPSASISSICGSPRRSRSAASASRRRSRSSTSTTATRSSPMRRPTC